MSDNPTKILVNTSGTQVGTVSNPLYLSSSLATTFVINNSQTIAPVGPAGLQGPTGSAGVPGGSSVVTGTWRDPGNAFITTGSVSIDSQDRTTSQIGSDVFFFNSGSVNVPSGTNRKVSLFGGDTVNSGTIFLGNLTTRPTVAPVSGCIIYSYGGDVYRFMSTGHHQALGEKYVTITMPTGSNYTMTVDEYTATIIYLHHPTAIARNLYVPIVSGYKWVFFLSPTSVNGYLNVIGNTGTGWSFLVPGYSGTLFADGTNVQQISTGNDAI